MTLRDSPAVKRIILAVGWLKNNYYARRIGMSLLIFFITVTITFVIYRLMPMGPYEVMMAEFQTKMAASGGAVSDMEYQQMKTRIEILTNIHPDRPIYIQYLLWMERAIFHLDFGTSLRTGDPVFELLFRRMPWSVFISLYGFALGTSVSLVLGALMANYEGSRFDMGLTVWTLFNQSVPYYIFAIMAIIVFGFILGWFPTAGKYGNGLTPGYNLPFMKSVAMHAALPIGSTFVASFGGALAFRGNAIREKGKEYIRVGRLRGISETRLGLRYVGRNALLPVYTGLMMGLSALFGGNIIIETIFNYRAVGLTTFGALTSRDYSLLMGAFIFYTLITLIGILMADLTYGIIDPRVKGGGDRETY